MKRRVILHIPSDQVSQPILYDVVKDYDVSFNILRAQVLEDEEGKLTLEFSGGKSNVDKAIKLLQERGIGVRELSRDILRDIDKCTHCGACVGQCPTSALSVQPSTQEVQFNPKKCILCELCVAACIYNAMMITHNAG